jgi:hypothetical protein
MAFRDLIVHNFRRKLFALLLAILIWLTIHFWGNDQKGVERSSRQSQTNFLEMR